MTLKAHMIEQECLYLTGLLKEEQGSLYRVAGRAGINSKTLYRKMRRHGLDKVNFKKQEEGVTDGRAESTDNGTT